MKPKNKGRERAARSAAELKLQAAQDENLELQENRSAGRNRRDEPGSFAHSEASAASDTATTTEEPIASVPAAGVNFSSPRDSGTPKRRVSKGVFYEAAYELYLTYMGHVVTRHGVLTKCAGMASAIPAAGWIIMAKDEVEILTINDVIRRLTYVPPHKVSSSGAEAFSWLLSPEFMLPTDDGVPLIGVLGVGGALKSTLCSMFFLRSKGTLRINGEPGWTAMISHIARVIGDLRGAHLTGVPACVDGLRAWLLGPGSARKSGLRAGSIIDLAALASACANSVITIVPPIPEDDERRLQQRDSNEPTPSSGYIALEVDMETAQLALLSSPFSAKVKKGDPTTYVMRYKAMGRAGSSRAGTTIREFESGQMEWARNSALNCYPPVSGWTPAARAEYDKYRELTKKALLRRQPKLVQTRQMTNFSWSMNVPFDEIPNLVECSSVPPLTYRDFV